MTSTCVDEDDAQLKENRLRKREEMMYLCKKEDKILAQARLHKNIVYMLSAQKRENDIQGAEECPQRRKRMTSVSKEQKIFQADR